MSVTIGIVAVILTGVVCGLGSTCVIAVGCRLLYRARVRRQVLLVAREMAEAEAWLDPLRHGGRRAERQLATELRDRGWLPLRRTARRRRDWVHRDPRPPRDKDM